MRKGEFFQLNRITIEKLVSEVRKNEKLPLESRIRRKNDKIIFFKKWVLARQEIILFWVKTRKWANRFL